MSEYGFPIEEISGRAIPLVEDDIDTDRIIPGRYLLCTTFAGLGENVFADDRKDPDHPFSNPGFEGAAILLTGRNFGCGSSREHAPQALRLWGIKAVVGESFAEIFLDNAVSCGIVCAKLQREIIDRIAGEVRKDPGCELVVSVKEKTISYEGGRYPFTMSDSIQKRFLEGKWDALSLLQEPEEEIERLMGRLPYLNFR